MCSQPFSTTGSIIAGCCCAVAMAHLLLYQAICRVEKALGGFDQVLSQLVAGAILLRDHFARLGV
eukprot:59070-Prorocentrum_lima.AAC.1